MDVIWFRPPAGDTGTLNACYNAVDIHVIRGRAEQVALLDGDRPVTFARLLTEVGAFAGVLQAFGVGLGDEVVVMDAPPLEDTVAQLACARVGAVLLREPSPAPALAVVGTAAGHDFGAVALVTVDDSGELDWATAMRAGRTDPAGCAEVPGDALLRVTDGTRVATAAHLLAVAAGEVVDPVLTSLMAGETLVLAGDRS
ncbi:AMP-binding protein [Nocardioides sp.]|uniref:AMP-binding protein n=1 Tax=Nocardioides sp. TaxID=35761 RepID=UPI00286D99CF|nr:AMP-binding protein [Nocardioides sp.]